MCLGCYSICKTKSSDECVHNFQKFVVPQCKPEHVYTDNSEEFKNSLKEIKWLHDTSTQNRAQTNGVVERAVRKAKEGTSCALVQSGFDEAWWGKAMLCYFFLKNVVDILDNDDTSHKRRFGSDYLGPLIPFGAEISYLPITDKDKARCHQLGSKLLFGIFLGYDQQAGGGWSGDLLVAD